MNIKEGEIHALKLLDMWKKGMSPRQIAAALDEPVDDVYRLLKEMEKNLVEEGN
jgi:hypothetical protein